ncbi:MAG TPA: MFS transporter [Tepidisphaeraceae bacterium]|nr:MFS transporter [Tepidisphaeraceae bacterium]
MQPPQQPKAYEPPDPERPASAALTEPELEREMPGGHDTGGHDPYAALRVPGYRLYALGTILLFMGQQAQSVAIGWELAVRDPKHAAMALSFVGLVGAAPVILLALPAGQLADRIDRKRLVIAMAILAAMCSVGLSIFSYQHWPTSYMYGLLLLGATAWALGGPARSALAPQIVPINVFSNAMMWAATFFQVSAISGPALAGWIIGWEYVHLRGRTLPTLPLAYLIDAFSGVAFAILLLFVRVRPIETRKEPASLKTLLAGIHFVGRNQIILATITLDLFAVLLGGATYLLPIYATSILHVGAQGFGWLRAAPALGAATMAMAIAHLPPMKRAGRDLLLAVIGFGVATIVFGLSKSFWLSLAMLYLTGAFDNISVVVRHTLVQVLTPDEMRGRVSAVNNVFIGASNELGGWESGLTAQIFGPVISVVGGGIGTILVVIATALTWPRLRQFGSLHDAKPIEEAEVPVATSS